MLKHKIDLQYIAAHCLGINKDWFCSLLHIATLTFSLVILWLLLSGYFVPLILTLGIASVLMVVWLAHRMDVIDNESHPIHMVPKGFLYYPWLAWEIVKANLDVAHAILKGSRAWQPRVFKLKATQSSDVGRVTYANSITLTPGTVSIFVDGDEITVHSLTPSAKKDLESGEMDRRVSMLEGYVSPGSEGAG